MSDQKPGSQRLLHVHFLPDSIHAGQLVGAVAVVIDVLRASSTIVTALHQGATRVIPCLTVGETVRWVSQSHDSGRRVLRGGERGGVRIDGFDCGNSPAEYSVEVVTGADVIFTTTNGTRALLRCCEARRVLVGSFLNLDAVATHLRSSAEPVHLVCAGTNGDVTSEDVLFAGALVDVLLSDDADSAAMPSADRPTGCSWQPTDSARIAQDHWQRAVGLPDDARRPSLWATRTVRGSELDAAVAAALQATQGGRNLLALGYGEDLRRCSHCSSLAAIPVYSDVTHDIRLLAQ